ncbi:aromatic ring-hydroxylating oxygenase subunit alpha [Ramlibacter humi]|nr:SRPBCC family protein [Ramlibacter humi]
MQADLERALIRRALALIDSGGTEAGEPARSPVERYLDPDRHRREVERIFRRYPLAVCPSGALTQAGDTHALDVAGMPLLLARGEDGEVRAFLNACRHRGARLQAPGAGQQRTFVCPYHSWSYRLDGTLRGRPHANGFPHAPAHECSLVRVPASEALGLIWVIPRGVEEGESPELDLSRWLGAFANDLRGWGYDRWLPFHRREFANAANWKIPFEGNLETYHFQYAHRDSIAGLFHDNLLIADQDGLHHRLVLPKRSMASLRELPESEWRIGPHANIIYCFFPATLILHEGDHANAFTVLPEAVDRSRVLGTTLIPELPATEKSRGYWEKNVASFWGALDEDFALGVSQQSTMASGANRELLFGRTEWCSAKFHEDVERLIGVGLG